MGFCSVGASQETGVLGGTSPGGDLLRVPLLSVRGVGVQKSKPALGRGRGRGSPCLDDQVSDVTLSQTDPIHIDELAGTWY